MNAEELRIGNLIKAPILINGKTVIQEVVSIGVKYAQLKNLPDGFAEHIKYDEIEPIPLTEEWFDKLSDEEWEFVGYGTRRIMQHKKHKAIKIEYGAYHTFILYMNDAIINYVQYVHEAQNLYYALTKEELKFEL